MVCPRQLTNEGNPVFVFIYVFLEASRAHMVWPLAVWYRGPRLIPGAEK